LKNSVKYPTLVLFDGFCNLCSWSVDFIMNRDRKGLFRFVALQSEAGQYLMEKYRLATTGDSVILWEAGRFYYYSDAALRIARRLQFPWPLLGVFSWLPLWIRDPVYLWIARNRYRWFGKRELCRMPGKEDKLLFPGRDELQLEAARFEATEKKG
jgi:predicted DCC family thiol-disulfide oxidoreductase YuxK